MKKKKPTLYLETSVLSVMTARPTSDLIALGKQQLTRLFWERRIHQFEVYVSEMVINEARRGDRQAAAARLRAIEKFPVLRITNEVWKLADEYMRAHLVPEKKSDDAVHIALAAVFEIEYLLTWNCAHIAGISARK